MVLQFASEPHRHAVQFNLRKLKGKEKWHRVSIVPDLTKLQCIEKKQKYQIQQEEIQ